MTVSRALNAPERVHTRNPGARAGRGAGA
ncbi:hypothetical protein, partial [Streptosporangium vulgare]